MRRRIELACLALMLAAATARADILPTPDRGPPMGSAGGLRLRRPIRPGRDGACQRAALLKERAGCRARRLRRRQAQLRSRQIQRISSAWK